MGDQEYENFWLTFKDLMLKKVNDELKDELIKISQELNSLQHARKYTEIYDKIDHYMNSHIKQLALIAFADNDYVCADRFLKNVNRWNKISGLLINNLDFQTKLILTYFNYVKKNIQNLPQLYFVIKTYVESEDNCDCECDCECKCKCECECDCEYENLQLIFSYSIECNLINLFDMISTEIASFIKSNNIYVYIKDKFGVDLDICNKCSIKTDKLIKIIKGKKNEK
jgi:hypothetical protein